MTSIHPTAIVSAKARLADGVQIGAYSIVHEGVELGKNVFVGNYCELGLPTGLAKNPTLVIGRDSQIRSHAVIYQGSELGPTLQTGHFVSIRENTRTGDGVVLGTRCQIEGDCVIGHYSRLHSDVHVAKSVQIGQFAFLYPRVQFTNDPLPPTHIEEPVVIEDLAVVCTGTLLLPGITVGTGAFIGAGSVVRQDVPAVMFATGNPAKVQYPADRLFNVEHGLRFAWLDHFRDRYPAEAQNMLDSLTERCRTLVEIQKAARPNERECGDINTIKKGTLDQVHATFSKVPCQRSMVK